MAMPSLLTKKDVESPATATGNRGASMEKLSSRPLSSKVGSRSSWSFPLAVAVKLSKPFKFWICANCEAMLGGKELTMLREIVAPSQLS